MASSISLGPAWCMDGPTTDASLVRALAVAALAYNVGSASTVSVLGGVEPGPAAMAVTAPGGMQVGVSSGFCVVPATAVSNGAYLTGLLTNGTLTVATADPTNPRIDLVCVTVSDLGNSSSAAVVQIITGTPAASPVVPSLPSYSIPLAQVAVAAAATTISTGNITDERTWTAAPGAIMPVQSLAAVSQGYRGAYVHDLATGRLAHNSGSGVKQPVLLPFAPVIAYTTTQPTGSGGAERTILTQSVTTDGNTDLEIVTGWAGAFMNTFDSGAQCLMRVRIDGTAIDRWCFDITSAAGPGNGSGGASKVVRTQTALSTRPGAGTHTVTWTFEKQGGGSHSVYLDTGSDAPLTLRISPVPL